MNWYSLEREMGLRKFMVPATIEEEKEKGEEKMKKETLDKLSPEARAEIQKIEAKILKIEKEVKVIDGMIEEVENKLKMKGGNDIKWI